MEKQSSLLAKQPLPLAARKKYGFWANLKYDLRKNPALLLMMIPSVLFFLVFSYIPMVGIYYAFTKYNVRKGLFGSPFCGLYRQHADLQRHFYRRRHDPKNCAGHHAGGNQRQAL